MKKIVSTFLVVCVVLISKQSISIEKGKWSLVKDEDWCYIGSSPLKTDLPETKKKVRIIFLFIKLMVMGKTLFKLKQGINII